jgi:creatinine amidohydrolase
MLSVRLLNSTKSGEWYSPRFRWERKIQVSANCRSASIHAVEPRKDYFDEAFDDHVGEQETSVMMHYHPELVDLSTAGTGESRPFNIDGLNAKTGWVPRDWSKVTTDTGVGNPLKSTAEKGARYATAVTDKIAAMINELVTKELY